MISIILAMQIAAATAVVRSDSTGATRMELPNGLRVWIQPERSRPVALVQVTYKVGSLHDPVGLTGTAHYVEHMVYRATKNVRNEDSYGYIDRIGGRYTGGTWPEVTKYAELVPSWAVESALRITAERMTNALFDSLEFERERSNVITEANGYADQDPVNAFQDAVMQASFVLHPYRYNSNTWAQDNLVITRAQAYDWYKRHYGPNNAVLAIVGDVDVDAVRALVIKHFAALPRASESGHITLVEPPQRAEKRVTITAPDVAKRLDVVYRSPNAAHPDYPALVVLNRVLRARLQRALADAGQLTTADSAAQYPYVYRISFTAKPDGDLERALGIVQSQIDSIAASGITAAELAVAREPPRPPRHDEYASSSVVPPRRSFLSETANALTAREDESWEVNAALLARLAESTRRITSDDVSAYASRWLRKSQRTIGFLLPGDSDFEPRWTNGRALVPGGERLEIPPLTTLPAKRVRPEPVPARALQPLQAVRVPNARRVLRNGVVVRVATSAKPTADSATYMRVSFTSTADSAAAATLVGRDTGLKHARITWLRDTTGESRPLIVGIAASARAASLEGLSTIGSRVFGAAAGSGKREAGSEKAETRTNVASEQRVTKASEPQVAITATLPGIPRNHPDRRALELLNYIVGVPWYGGRLGWALTKTGLTYSAAAITTFGSDRGRITLTTTCDTRNTDAVIQAIREVVAGVGENGVEDWELREAQAFVLGRTLLYGPREDSDAFALAAALVEAELSGGGGGVDAFDLPALSRAYLSVTLEQLNRAARRYYRADQLRVVATGAVPPQTESVFPRGTFRRLFD